MSEYESKSGIGIGSVIAVIIVLAVILGALSALGINAAPYIGVAIGIIVAVIVASGIRVIRPTSKGVIERLGKFQRVKSSGLTWIMPFIDRMTIVNITEQMTEAEKQEIITKDNLNANVAALIRYKVGSDDESVKDSLYKVNNYRTQIVQLTRTTLRNVIGMNDFNTVNSERPKLNTELKNLLQDETKKWGIEVVSAELKEIEPPKAVQETMNNVIQAANRKQAAVDLATAAATEADGERQASIKRAEGNKQSLILKAEGEATAITTVAKAQAEQIKLVNEAAQTYFKDGAVTFKQLETTLGALQNNTKYVLTQDGISPTIILPQTDDKAKPEVKIIPVEVKKKTLADPMDFLPKGL